MKAGHILINLVVIVSLFRVAVAETDVSSGSSDPVYAAFYRGKDLAPGLYTFSKRT